MVVNSIGFPSRMMVLEKDEWMTTSTQHRVAIPLIIRSAFKFKQSPDLICCPDEPPACILLQMLAPSHRAQVLF